MNIQLDEVIEALEFTGNGVAYVYDPHTNRILLYSEDGFVKGEISSEEVEEGDYIPLPDRYELHEYDWMEAFIEQLPSSRAQRELSVAIRGRGAFRKFKDAVQDLGLAQDWYTYRDEIIKQKAITWCEEHQIPYE